MCSNGSCRGSAINIPISQMRRLIEACPRFQRHEVAELGFTRRPSASISLGLLQPCSSTPGFPSFSPGVHSCRLLAEGQPTGEEKLVPPRGPGLPPFEPGTILNPKPWEKVGPYSLALFSGHLMTLPFTPNHPSPWTQRGGCRDIFHFLHCFINQMIQNHHQFCKCPSTQLVLSLPRSHPPQPVPRPPCCLTSPAPAQGQSWEVAGAELKAGGHSTGQTAG